jgi:hypothetical protein
MFCIISPAFCLDYHSLSAKKSTAFSGLFVYNSSRDKQFNCIVMINPLEDTKMSISGVHSMQLADLMIDPQQAQQLIRTYEGLVDLEGVFTSAESQFEQESLALVEEGWQLKQVSHRGTIVSPSVAVIATYER